MAITGRTEKACFDQFTAHVQRLVSKTLTPTGQVRTLASPERMVLSFVGDTRTIKIVTRVGPLFFYLGQALEAVADPIEGYRLKTRRYWYRLQESPAYKADALFRWEYDYAAPRDRYARHHVQLAGEIIHPGTDEAFSLSKAHLPTGWVTVEEIIRFMICDLGHKPPCGSDWPKVLEDSVRPFYEQFTSPEDFYQGT